MKSVVCAAIAFPILLTGIVNTSCSGEEEPDNQWGKPVAGCRFGIVPQHESFRYDQPVILNMIVKNERKEDIYVPSGPYFGTYRFDVRLPNGKAAPLTLNGTRLANDPVGGESNHKLKPGASHTEGIMLNRYYDMTLLGEYTITMQRAVPSEPRADGTWELVTAPSNTLKIVVREYNAQEIKAKRQQQEESNKK